MQSISNSIPLASLSNTLKKDRVRQYLLSPFSRYYCSIVGRYYDPHRGSQGAERVKQIKENLIIETAY